MEFYSNCCNSQPITEVFEDKDSTLGYCSDCKRGAVFSNRYQMSEIEQNAFEEHCRASETYKYLKIDMQAQAEKWLDEMRPTGEMAEEDFDRFEELHLERFLDDCYRYRTIKVKGYDKNAPLPCYACATQRHKCEHDFSDDSLGDYPCSEDDSQDYPEDWKDV